MRTCRSLLVLVVVMVSLAACAGDRKPAAQASADVPVVTSAQSLPDAPALGRSLRVTKSLESDLDVLLKAATSVNGEADAQCKIECDHEIGAITCPVGKQCSCSCPGGYSYCSCKT